MKDVFLISVAYIVVGAIITELALSATRKQGQKYETGAYFVNIFLWPLTTLLAIIAIIRKKVHAGNSDINH